ncbi:MAG: IS6 family transposase [Flavisolibacter sp.]|nr:IS6 family transposase [Flavisolibacter sp.]MBD0364660.1 IS6 family transposase [Flavisolibacter sp.]
MEELLSISRVVVDYATLQRWVYKFAAPIEKTLRRRKKAVSNSWRMDKTYIKVKGEWMYFYRAVDKEGNTGDFLLTNRRNKYAAHKFLLKAINNMSCPRVIKIDQSRDNKEVKRITKDLLRNNNPSMLWPG